MIVCDMLSCIPVCNHCIHIADEKIFQECGSFDFGEGFCEVKKKVVDLGDDCEYFVCINAK